MAALKPGWNCAMARKRCAFLTLNWPPTNPIGGHRSISPHGQGGGSRFGRRSCRTTHEDSRRSSCQMRRSPLRASTASPCVRSFTSRRVAAGTTIQTDWSITTASTTSFSSTIPTVSTGATCIGGTQFPKTSCSGPSLARRSIPTRWAPCSAAARWLTTPTPAVSVATDAHRWC